MIRSFADRDAEALFHGRFVPRIGVDPERVAQRRLRLLHNAEALRDLATPPVAFVVRGVCVLRYDNETGKGDHVHMHARERPDVFVDPERLVADFFADVRSWLDENRDA